MATEIHQILPNMAYGDAISNHALELKRLFRSWGYSSEIYAQVREPTVTHACSSIKEFKPKKENLTIYHYSIGCKEVSELFLRIPGRKVLAYHNITPHHYFLKYSGTLYELLQKGREALGSFKDRVDLAIGDSGYNTQELVDAGYRNTVTLPIFVDFKKFEKASTDPQVLKYIGQGWTNFLFTGRVVPNKAPQDVIRCYAWYYHNVDPVSRLFLVGSTPYGSYVQELYRLAKSLGVENHVFIPGHVKFSELISYYKAADVFLCMSEHEGFCVPLLESMLFDVPIVAYATTGVPYTMGDAGILLKEKNYMAASEVAYLLAQDPEFRQKIVLGQRRRLAQFQPQVVSENYRAVFQEFLGSS